MHTELKVDAKELFTAFLRPFRVMFIIIQSIYFYSFSNTKYKNKMENSSTKQPESRKGPSCLRSPVHEIINVCNDISFATN